MLQLEQANILIVDPDANSLFEIAGLLLSQDHKVVTARNETTARTLAENEALDLLILDRRLANHGALEFARSILGKPGKSDLPVMFLSSAQKSDVSLKHHDFGDAYHLKKPIAPQSLFELVEHALWMPHLVRNHLQKHAMREPHVSFAKKPMLPSSDQHRPSAPAFLNYSPVSTLQNMNSQFGPTG